MRCARAHRKTRRIQRRREIQPVLRGGPGRVRRRDLRRRSALKIERRLLHLDRHVAGRLPRLPDRRPRLKR